MNICMSVAAVSIAFCFGTTLSAATINFTDGTTTGGSVKTYTEGGFQFYDARIVGGPCEVAGADKCAALNPHEVTVLTRVGGGVFDFTSIWFYLNGKASDGTNALAIFDTNNTAHRYDLTQPAYTHNTGYTVALDFTNVTSITFDSGGVCIPKGKKANDCKDQGNARFDTAVLSYDVAEVPLPAGGILLAGALAGLGALRRRKAL